MYLEVDSAGVAVDRLEQRGSETELHGERRHVWFVLTQPAYGPDRQRLELHVTAV